MKAQLILKEVTLVIDFEDKEEVLTLVSSRTPDGLNIQSDLDKVFPELVNELEMRVERQLRDCVYNNRRQSAICTEEAERYDEILTVARNASMSKREG